MILIFLRPGAALKVKEPRDSHPELDAKKRVRGGRTISKA